MAISLKKGQKVDLTKTNSDLSKILIGLSLDTNRYDGGSDFDLNSSVFLLGTVEGDDEENKIDRSKVSSNIEKISFTVTIYEAEARKQNFGQVENAFIRVFDEQNNKELIRYDVD